MHSDYNYITDGVQEKATEIIRQATDKAAQIEAKYIEDVIIHFLQTEIGMLILFLLIVCLAFKIWNWKVRDSSNHYIKKIAKKQEIIYQQQAQILNELRWVNKAIQPKTQQQNNNNNFQEKQNQ